MVGILTLFLTYSLRLFKSDEELRAENTYLRHQLGVLRRKAPRKITLTNWERWVFVWLYRLRPSVLFSTYIINPKTVLRWHRQGFRAYWRRKSYYLGGRPHIDKELRMCIREMSIANPLWGAPRIHGELLRLGFKVSQTTVARYMIKGLLPPSQSWKTFLRNHADGIAAIDFLIVPTINFKLLYVLVIIHHETRKLVYLDVAHTLSAEWIVQALREAFPWEETPDYLIRDNEGVYGHSYRTFLAAAGIRDSPTTPHSPWQNAYVERLIGPIRRECLDHIIILNAEHLRRVMKNYAEYYNSSRTHLSLDKNSPLPRPIQSGGLIKSLSVLGGLHHRYSKIE